jgi:lipoprotein-anchoring transpeptidase ErfK/SrfK
MPAFATGAVPATLVTTPTTAPEPDVQPGMKGPFLVARPLRETVPVYTAPSGALLYNETTPTHDGVGLAFLVSEQRPNGWLQVMLPRRPNGSIGYIRTSDVSVVTITTQIKVELAKRRLTAWDGDKMFLQEPVAIGVARTPTPLGTYYLQDSVAQMNTHGAYGPYILAVSAHSEVLKTFGGGDGLTGIHGTNQPGLIGSAVSNGCIRMTNDAITRLARGLSQGSPIVIVP